MKDNILLVTPPLLQLNTPYPALLYLLGYLRQKGYTCTHYDLNIECAHSIFNSEFISKMYEVAISKKIKQPFHDFYKNRERYISTIDPVIKFLTGANRTYAHRIISRDLLPEGPHFDKVENSEIFSIFDTLDKGRYLATLYIEDIALAIRCCLDKGFEIVKYKESTALGIPFFKTIQNELIKKPSQIENTYLDLLRKKIVKSKPTVIGFTIPFPGTLFSVLRCSQMIKNEFPDIIICAGGGFVNTELRNITSTDFFKYIDYLFFDDGEIPFEKLLEYRAGKIDKTEIHNCLSLQGNSIANSVFKKSTISKNIMFPDYTDTDPSRYISMFDSDNPMMRLWNDGFWNKLTIAHGCYWSRCTFCDTSLDYINNFHPLHIEDIIARIEKCIIDTGETGFHFTDEAAPPALLKKIAIELLKRNISITYWTNVRFDTCYTADLAKLLAMSGCIALAGGLEVASPRILSLIDKGVTVNQIAKATYNLSSAGILVHAYLMYGYPGQTAQETVDSLETVRQLFANGCIDSAYWHKFTLTCHSRIFSNPEKYGIKIKKHDHDFCMNDIAFNEINRTNHDNFTTPLNRALYNYMKMRELDKPVQHWFGEKTAPSAIKSDFIAKSLNSSPQTGYKSIFIARKPEIYCDSDCTTVSFYTYGESYEINVSKKTGSNIGKFYNSHGLYMEFAFDETIEILAPILDTDKNNIFFEKTFIFLREFSLFVL
ncbi:MAG: radical SAM protein [Spirochaetes bacterium]|nr:radical SAM protein [Spirochaetota bacterium]MBN2770538.1 radical SAM protein [Spirochaetota bacterium]